MVLLKHADFIIGNSSCILKEAVCLDTAGINVGSRQQNREGLSQVTSVACKSEEILKAIACSIKIQKKKILVKPQRSDEKFIKLLENGDFFRINKQKIFKDLRHG